MKRKHVNIGWIGFAGFLLVCFGLYWITHRETLKTLQEKYPQAKVYYESDSPTPIESEHPKIAQVPTRPADENIESSTSSTTRQTNGSILIDHRITASIRDVLGEPIERGIIQLGNKEFPFQRGQVEIPVDRSWTEPVLLIAQADGYRSATQTIQPQETTQIDLILDYFCNFEVCVYDRASASQDPSRWNPQVGAEVTLYRATLCKRPLTHSQQALIELDFTGKPQIFGLLYEDGMIQIETTKFTSYWYTDLDIPVEFNSHEFDYPHIGDTLLSIGTRNITKEKVPLDPCKFHIARHQRLYTYALSLQSPVSENARIMDTLQLSLKEYVHQKDPAEIRFSRTDGRFCSKCLYLPSFQNTETVIAQSVTDDQGKCRFENLPPGLYYAQARYNNECSMIRPLFPASGGAKLILNSNSRVTVYSWREGIPPDYFLQAERLSPVDLTLRSKNSTTGGLYTIQTNVLGMANFDQIPFGEYSLTAAPPPNSNLSPIHKDVTIQLPAQSVYMLFNEWDRHSIEGTVVFYDTLAPIPDVRLELYEYRFTEFYPSAVTQTDENGAFAFRNLPQGKYRICFIPDLRNPHQYYSFEPSQRWPKDHAPFYIPRGDDRMETVIVQEKPVYTVEIKMVGTVATRFSGQVLDTQQKPVPGAQIKLYRNAEFDNQLEIYPPHGKFVSDEEGNFDITLWTRDFAEWKNYSYTGKLTAKTFLPIPKQALQDPSVTLSRGLEFITGYNPPQMTGELPLQFTLGKHHKNLQLIVDGERMITLEGRIRTEDGRIPDDAKVTIVYTSGNSGIMGEYKPNGDFSIVGVENKEFILRVRFAYCTNEDEENPVTEYLDEEMVFYASQINEIFRKNNRDGEKIKIEILLKESGYLKGIILDAHQNPVEGLCVRTAIDLGVARCATTDKKGKFTISQVKKDQQYSLYASKDIEDKQPLLLMSGLQPNVENMILPWPTEPE